MADLRELNYHEVVKRLVNHGFRFYRKGKGSHEIWVRDSDGCVVPVPHYQGKPIRKGTLRAIIKQVGVSVSEFMDL
jgi:predicted RNA binding protein YcfA (HicA-like mRNA interferase family)